MQQVRVCTCAHACVVCTRIFGILQLSARPGAGEAGRKGAPGSGLTGPPCPPQTLSGTTYWADSHRQLQLHLPMFFPVCNFNPSGVPPTEAGAADSLKRFQRGSCHRSFFSRQFHLSPVHCMKPVTHQSFRGLSSLHGFALHLANQ